MLNHVSVPDGDAAALLNKRIIVLAGHYGSGKTTLAVNMALDLAKEHKHVALCDIDIVNPYFRSIHHREILENAGVRLISSTLAGTGVESPGFPPEAVSVFDNPSYRAVIDVGGDDRGALALGRYSKQLTGDAAVLLVANKFRPLSKNPADILAICREIENAGRFRFSGIINNSNLGEQTTLDAIISGIPYAEEISKLLDLPLVAMSVCEDYYQEIYSQKNKFQLDDDLFLINVRRNLVRNEEKR